MCNGRCVNNCTNSIVEIVFISYDDSLTLEWNSLVFEIHRKTINHLQSPPEWHTRHQRNKKLNENHTRFWCARRAHRKTKQFNSISINTIFFSFFFPFKVCGNRKLWAMRWQRRVFSWCVRKRNGLIIIRMCQSVCGSRACVQWRYKMRHAKLVEKNVRQSNWMAVRRKSVKLVRCVTETKWNRWWDERTRRR